MRSLIKTLIITGAAVSIAGAAAAATPTPVYLAKAGASDLFEIRSSKLVMGSHNPGVRRFAAEMVTDHTKSTAMVKSAARRAGLHPKPPMLNGEQRSNIAALTRAHGEERDRLYIQQQQASHQQALELQTDYSQTGNRVPLKRAAAKIVPVVQHHIDMLQHMS